MTFIFPLSSQDKDPELSHVSLPDPVPFLISFWNHTNLASTPPSPAQLSIPSVTVFPQPARLLFPPVSHIGTEY